MKRYDVADIGHDPDTLEAFYREHLAFIQHFIARRATDPADAADLTADVFLEAIHCCSRFDPRRGQPVAWLVGIARNVIAQHQRDVARSGRAHSRLAARDWLDDDTTERIAARIDAERESRDLLSALADLPERQRSVVELVAVDGFSLIDAAAALGISHGAARVRYFRARSRLGTRRPGAASEQPPSIDVQSDFPTTQLEEHP